MRVLRRVVRVFRRHRGDPDRPVRSDRAVDPAGPVGPDRLAVYNTTDARTAFASLLRRVSYGEEIVIARAGVPVAKLVPYRGERVYQGLFRSHFRVAADSGGLAVTPTRSSRAAST